MIRKIKNKKHLYIIIVLIVAITLSMIGATFAYFTARITGNENIETIRMGAGRLTIHYENTKNINAIGIFPGDDPIDVKIFTVTGRNNTELHMPYYINLHITENTFQDGSIRYKLTSFNTTNNGDTAPSIDQMQEIFQGSDIYSLGKGTFHGPNRDDVHTYHLSLYFPSKGIPMNEDQGKNLSGYISITENPISTRDVTIALYIDGKRQPRGTPFPAKDSGIGFEKVVCDHSGTGDFNWNKWELGLIGLTDGTICTIYFVTGAEEPSSFNNHMIFENSGFFTPEKLGEHRIILIPPGGGGGSGGSSHPGRSGGAFGGEGGMSSVPTIARFNITSFDPIPISIGIPGTGAASQTIPGNQGNSGNAGGITSFGNYISVNGGIGGKGGATGAINGADSDRAVGGIGGLSGTNNPLFGPGVAGNNHVDFLPYLVFAAMVNGSSGFNGGTQTQAGAAGPGDFAGSAGDQGGGRIGATGIGGTAGAGGGGAGTRGRAGTGGQGGSGSNGLGGNGGNGGNARGWRTIFTGTKEYGWGGFGGGGGGGTTVHSGNNDGRPGLPGGNGGPGIIIIIW